MLLKIVLTLLALFTQDVEGFEKVIVVAGSNVTDLFLGDVRGSCCVYGSCPCPSLYVALDNLTSNVLINITTDVELPSIIPIIGISNIAITGHNNPAVYCNNSGGLHFISCYNCTIEGITWGGCGAMNISGDDNSMYPVLQFTNSSNITIQNCSFQQSIGQAVVLSGMSGDVNINNCNFLYNKQYEGHGTAVHFSSNDILTSSPFKFTINGCDFFHNERAKSIIYLAGHISNNFCEYFKLVQNCKFYLNKGVPIYLSNQDLFINGYIKFSNNIAENGGGIFISDHSNVIIHKSATVNFTNNTATNNGGAIFLTNHSSILFKDHSTSYQCYDNGLYNTINNQILVTFSNNTASGFGQHIYAHSSNITVGNDATIIFDSNGYNFPYYYSSAIHIKHYCTVTFEGNSKTTYSNQVVRSRNGEHGGILYITDYSSVTFKGNSTVTLNYNKAYNTDVGAVYIDHHSVITFKGNCTVILSHNEAYDAKGGAMYINSSTITFEEYSTVTFNSNVALIGGAMYIDYSTIAFEGNSTVTFFRNNAVIGGAVFIGDDSTITFLGNSAINFTNNGKRNGFDVVAIYSDYNNSITFQENCTLTFNGNDAGAMSIHSSTITFLGNAIVMFTNNGAYGSKGGAMYLYYSSVTILGNSTVTFTNNGAYGSEGGAVYIGGYSVIIFDINSTCTVTYYGNIASTGSVMYILSSTIIFLGNSTVTFNNSGANYTNGGVVYTKDNSIIIFKGNSTVKFYNNTATNGGAMYIDDNSTIIFEGNSTVTFNNNSALQGGTMYVNDHSTITLEGTSTVRSDNNVGISNGGAIYINHYSTLTFKENCLVKFSNNKVNNNNGGAVYSDDTSTITFEGHTTVSFNNNGAKLNGGALYTAHSDIIFQENSTVTFDNNVAVDRNGGAVYIGYSVITFAGNSAVICTDNVASTDGGVMYSQFYSNITCKGNSMVRFYGNSAISNGGALYINDNSTITFEGNSTVKFIKNSALQGGAIILGKSAISFMENSTITFTNNRAANGGTMYTNFHSAITFEGASTVTFDRNGASLNGGCMYICHYSTITFNETCFVKFSNNKVNINNGGAAYSDGYSAITFDGNSTVMFHNNTSDVNGGALFVNGNTDVTFKGKSNVMFYNNIADTNGGALCIKLNSTVGYTEYSIVMFNHNVADLGGSIFCESSLVDFGGNSFVMFTKNVALRDGGAVYCSDHSNFSHFNNSTIYFTSNTANDYGGAIYSIIEGSSINSNTSGIYFKDNRAGIIQNSFYINVPDSCNSSCLFYHVKIANRSIFQVTTSPHKLILHNPTKCINGTDATCDTYYINNIMLGQDITFDACVLDYYDQPTEATQFLITGMNHQDYNITGSKYITISCNHTIQGIRITGNLHLNNSYNYSMDISLYIARISESKVIAVNLIVELSQCHPGFWYSSKSQKCDCYDTENIISCTGSSSTIKRGYWFGRVRGKSTVTSCPNDYCNFTCCEITNGIYYLSPVRANQCRPHRSGTACGNCEKGYTLSFDSPDCVEVNKCTTGQTVLVITLSLLYWIAVVVAVFVMMYFKVTVGSLYAIIYYYSIVDILLSKILDISSGLYTTVSIMSSLAKLTPQFLGQLCLVQNMSGIDQQFIHYVHPTVISLILIMISMIARRSRRVSSFVGRGVIHFICFLLLLSYTSVATTSLLLMRPLTFIDVNKVYTYLSPDIEYLHGRHLVYTIVAIMFAIVIVIGFPLLLLLEPFLNSKVNFVKVKPLLDQFQGCYKDKYRCFAGYYMVCRLVIILLVIVKISDDFTNQYLLISSCTLMALIHVLVRPYTSTIHNVFDGIILHLIISISGLPVVEFVDNYDKSFAVVIIYLLVILPSTSFIAIKLWVNKSNMQNNCKDYITCCHKYTAVPTDNTEETTEMNDNVIIIDDNVRRNVNTVEV